MSYASISDLKKRISDTKLIQLTDFTAAGTLSEDKVAQALNSGKAMIESYTRGRYVLPLQASNQVKDLEMTIAVFKLYEGRQIMPELVRQSFEDAILFLKDVAAGKASLDQVGSVQSVETGVVIKDHDEDPDAFDDLRLADYMG